MPSWSNWSGLVTAEPHLLAAPESEAEVVEVVRTAAAQRRAVRTAGSGHSFTRLVATDDVIVSLAGLAGLVAADPAAGESGEAEVWAGTTIADLGVALHGVGLALRNQGDIDRQAIAGACGTGTHGTGIALPSFSAAVVGATLVLADGEVLRCSAEENPRVLAAARLSLGALGVVTRLRLAVRPAYRLHERTWLGEFADALAELDANTVATRHYEMFWLPDSDRVFHKSLAETGADPDPLPDARWERIGHSHQVFPSVRDERFNEMEYAVPAEAGPACLAAIRDLYRTEHPEVVWPVEYRTQAADDVWLSPANGRATVTISVHQDAALDHEPLFRDCEAVFRSFAGRPHWGKLHTVDPDERAATTPGWAEWWSVRDELDPDGRFLNEHLRGIAGR